MSTSITTETRKSSVSGSRGAVFAALFAGLLAHTEASFAADAATDTQSRVAAVLTGTHVDSSVSAASTTHARAESRYANDVYRTTQQVLLGINESNGTREGSVGSNGQSSVNALQLTQQVILGRATS